MQTIIKNRIHAVLHRGGVLEPKGSLFTRAGRIWLSEVALDEAGRSILDRYLVVLDELRQGIFWS